jgi:hypothetical protein
MPETAMSETAMPETAISVTLNIIQYETRELVKHINENDPQTLCEKTDNLLYSIFQNTDITEEIKYLSVIYRLIFQAYKQNPFLSYQLLSGFLRFGNSAEGTPYKPLLDHLAIKAFNKLFELGSWSILRDCINILRMNLDTFDTEPLFQHIISRIVKQLRRDEKETENLSEVSDICHYLPREKSFVWGWFAYYVAAAYYGANQEVLNNKKLRKHLMQYRKMITGLRKIVQCENPTTGGIQPYEHVKDSWADILLVLASEEHKWAVDLINNLMGKPDINEPLPNIIAVPVTVPDPVTELATFEIVPVLAESILAESILAESILAEHVLAESILAEHVLAEPSVPTEKKEENKQNNTSGWLGSWWGGWSS